MTENMFANAFPLHTKVKILRGEYLGQIGIYLGKKNNSNWEVVDVNRSQIIFNLEELEAAE